VLILLFGEILPKIYANRNAASFSLRMSMVLTVLDRLFSVLSVPMQNSTVWLENRLSKSSSNISVDHLSQALELASDSDTSNEEKRILEGIVTFGNTDTKQVMRPRIDIFAIAHDAPFQEVISQVTTKGYSRVPVYQESLDKVIGVLFLKDLLPHLDAEQFDWISLLREPFFVPENKKLDDLLLDFKSQKTHLAVVVDEYGGTSGIVTLEDVIEEIVGDISDDFDDVDLIYSKVDERTYVFEAKTSLKDFYKVIQIEDPSAFEQHKGESETLAGFVLEITKAFPKIGENIRFEGFIFTVESLDKRRLKRLKIKLPAQQ
jgi:putative hemolysin